LSGLPAEISGAEKRKKDMADTYVLIHGAWHCGELLETTADFLRTSGHRCYCPTLAGNRPDDDRSKAGLDGAVQSVIDFIDQHQLTGIRLVGHSYGGMVISGVADRRPDKISRLVYWNAFVPLDGESLNDMIPRYYVELFNQLSAQNNNAVPMPFPIWRDAFMNDADLELAKLAHDKLRPHPYNTFTDKISLRTALSDLSIGKSYLNCQQDIALPHSYPWHPRLSERLGLFRLVECAGGHELCFTNPSLLAQKIIEAGRD
jgi:pimeloyl-ACP methyl ester carboxylesterase